MRNNVYKPYDVIFMDLYMDLYDSIHKYYRLKIK